VLRVAARRRYVKIARRNPLGIIKEAGGIDQLHEQRKIFQIDTGEISIMKLNLILAKVFQFVIFVLFTFMALVYFGALLIVPLGVMAQPIKFFSAIGLPSVLSVIIGISILGYLGLAVSRMPELYKLVINIGIDLVSFGHTQIKRFDPLIEVAKAGKSANPA